MTKDPEDWGSINTACFLLRIERLEQALKPFVDRLEMTEKAHREMGFAFDVPDDKPLPAQFNGALTWGDLRRAREAYRGTK